MVNKRGQIYERNVRHAYLFLRRHFGSRSTVIPSPRGQDLSFSRWRRCYKSRGSFPVYLAAVVQKRSNAPVLGQKLATKVSKSRAIPPYVPGVTPPGWPLISAYRNQILAFIFSLCLENGVTMTPKRRAAINFNICNDLCFKKLLLIKMILMIIIY